ncbi:hypothetical protein [Bacillus sp. FDAARGOS_1420]
MTLLAHMLSIRSIGTPYGVFIFTHKYL